jgi:hypothetical protein
MARGQARIKQKVHSLLSLSPWSAEKALSLGPIAPYTLNTMSTNKGHLEAEAQSTEKRD